MSVWIIEKTASGKVIPLRELVYCSECVHRSVGVCLLKAMFTDGDDFCKHGTQTYSDGRLYGTVINRSGIWRRYRDIQ